MQAASLSSDYVFTLDEDARIYCEQNLNETEESRQTALTAIREWISENPTLHVKSDDKSLLPFLRGCKFNIQRTQEKLKNYYTMRRDVPEWFSNRNPLLAEIQELVQLGVLVPLRKTHNNQLVVIIRTAAHDPKKHKQDDVFKTGKMLLDIAAMEIEKTQVYGVIAIFDMAGVTLAHARQLPPSIIKKAVFAWQNYHCRPKNLEFVNAPLYINVVLNVFKQFMSNKLKGRVRVHFHGLESLHNVVSKDILPKEYGGDDEELEETIKYWHRKLSEYADWFQEDEKYKAE